MLARNERSNNVIGSDRVDGTDIYGSDGKKIGAVENLMIDKQSGQVTDAVISVGGFLGIGEERHSLPWQKLNYSTDHDGYVIDATKEQLKEAPRFNADDRDRPYDNAYQTGVYNYWSGIS